MSDSEPTHRLAVLSTGVRLPLLSVATILMSLEALGAGSPEERSALVALRNASLDDGNVSRDAVRHLLNEAGLVEPDGSIPPAIRGVVLAAVHGEAAGLYLGSPYTNFLDRAISDLIVSLAKVEAVLPPDQLATLLKDVPGGAESWVQRVKRTTGDGPSVPPPSAN